MDHTHQMATTGSQTWLAGKSPMMDSWNAKIFYKWTTGKMTRWLWAGPAFKQCLIYCRGDHRNSDDTRSQ